MSDLARDISSNRFAFILATTVFLDSRFEWLGKIWLQIIEYEWLNPKREESLPIPPGYEIVHLLFFFFIIKEVHDVVVEPLRVCHCVCPGKDWQGGQRETNLTLFVNIKKT